MQFFKYNESHRGRHHKTKLSKNVRIDLYYCKFLVILGETNIKQFIAIANIILHRRHNR